jgi:hypothetical protein
MATNSEFEGYLGHPGNCFGGLNWGRQFFVLIGQKKKLFIWNYTSIWCIIWHK